MVELRDFTAEILYLTMICRGLLSLRVSAVPPGHTCVTYVCPAKLARSLCPDLAACHTTGMSSPDVAFDQGLVSTLGTCLSYMSQIISANVIYLIFRTRCEGMFVGHVLK